MKKIFFLLFLACFSIPLLGKQVTIEQARKVAVGFLHSNSSVMFKSISATDLTYVPDFLPSNCFYNRQLKGVNLKEQDVYLFNVGEKKGFIVVSGDDQAMPILGYSNTGEIIKGNVPQNVSKWILLYQKQIQHIKNNSLVQTDTINDLWRGEYTKLKTTTNSVSPLIETTWGQSPYVNSRCPYDYKESKRTLTGCPATAMAQIMKFWNYPETGLGFHSYCHDRYGILSANFGSTTYEWDKMTNNVNSENDAVATLMYQCGVAIEMNYGVEGSSGYVIIDDTNRYPQERTSENAFVKYFGYSTNINGVVRASYTDTQWKNLLRLELDAGRPVQYAGFGSGGHTWVCDGYSDYGYFHMNWGWGGYCDGYFLLDALNPGEDSHRYSDRQQALIGIEPPEDESLQSYSLVLNSDVLSTKQTIDYSEDFMISANFSNKGKTTFTGEYAAVVFDEEYNYVEIIDTYEEINGLRPNYHYKIDIGFSCEGLLSMMPGKYYVFMFSKQDDTDWQLIWTEEDNETTVPYAEIEVTNKKIISVYSTMTPKSEVIYAHEELSVDVKIANFSDSIDFNGDIAMLLYDLDGDFKTLIELKETTLSAYKYRSMNFFSSSLDVEPGTYYMALKHECENGDFELTGSRGQNVNPLKIIVQEAPIPMDKYEDNDDIENAFRLEPSFDSNTGYINTEGSNIHNNIEWDFYQIYLEDGYSYKVNMRLHDSFNSANGINYSVDGVLYYSFDGKSWSDAIDDVLDESLKLKDGVTIYFAVGAYFSGEKGTYLLDVLLERKQLMATDIKSSVEDVVIVYPNPFKNSIIIECSQGLNNVRVYNLSGDLLEEYFFNSSRYRINTSSYPKGFYMLELNTLSCNRVYKIIKQ